MEWQFLSSILSSEKMDENENLVPRLLLAGTLITAVVLYSRRRRSHSLNAATATTAPGALSAATAGDVAPMQAGNQNLIEGVLDNVADQAMRELKVILKDGLKRLEKTVDSL